MINSYFRFDDLHDSKILSYTIPQEWWSRPWEYNWAISLAKPGNIVLDAGCGVEHPFKWMLCDKGCAVFAADADTRLALLPPYKYIDYLISDIKNLTELKDNIIDDIFCLSVLEHVIDDEDKRKILLEFYRILSPKGRIILTFDVSQNPAYSSISNPEQIVSYIDGLFNINLEETDFAIYEDCLKGVYSNGEETLVYHMILTK